MKKYFYLAAVSAMMLTACSSDKDVLEPTPTPSTPTVVAQQQAVAFDTYLAGTTASTRAGDPEGVMTTDKLKTANKGFGVFAYYADGGADYASSLTPNFMYNEQVSWANPNGGWTYSPLKYWPNETTNDSQDPTATATSAKPLDKLSFFAYAPYVSTGTGTGKTLSSSGASGKITNSWYGSETSGIMAIQNEATTGDPLVEWKYSSDVDHNVDLLWGVAPKGMDYTAVNGTTVPTHFGYPLTDLVKPDKDMKVKFLFQHALSRIGLSVVSAIDQIAAGDDGGKFNTNQTRVFIEEVSIKGTFGTQGVLNLNNTAENVANWSNVTYDDGTSVLFTFGDGETGSANKLISKDLRYADLSGVTTEAAFLALNEGVLPSEKLLVKADADPNKKVASATPAYATGTVLYHAVDGDFVVATEPASSDCDTYTKNANDDYTQVKAAGGGAIQLDGTTAYYNLGTPASTTATADIAVGDSPEHWTLSTDATSGMKTYTHHAAGTQAIADGATYYTISETALAPTGNKYSSGTYYTGLIPRYMMFIPSASGVKTNVTVKIKYHVVTYDEKLSNKKSDISNVIEKTASFQFENGKSYNLKLILGLTSVKLDATVADWQVGDDAEVWLPQNVQP